MFSNGGEEKMENALGGFIKGPRNFAEIRTVNGIVYETYQETCYALGLLDNDKEWHDAILEASN